LVQNWFSVGLYEWDAGTTYYVNFDGWAETGFQPYLTVTYTMGATGWLSLNGGAGVTDLVNPGDPADVIAVGYNTTGLAVGPYNATINIVTNEPGAKKTYALPVTLTVSANYVVTGKVYYGTGITKPMKSTGLPTNVTLTGYPGVITNVLGRYVFSGVANGNYTLSGNTTKPRGSTGGLTGTDATLAQQIVLGIYVPTNIEFKAADVAVNNTINNTDVTMIKRRVLFLTFPAWNAPIWVWETITVPVAGADVHQTLRTLLSGDVNGSFNPPAE
jgi:hypothetical protein